MDVSLISETKVDETFPIQRFKINGYKMFRKDRDRFGGGPTFYVNEQIPSKVLSTKALRNTIMGRSKFLKMFSLKQELRKIATTTKNIETSV